MKPKILDLFCGAGGAAMGLHRAGFEVVGVDIEPQRHFPFEFHQADALTFPLDGFDAYWASPPCQKFSRANQIRKREHPDLLTPIRERLVNTNKPFIIENVPGAPLVNYIKLHGTMFGLKTNKERCFELHGFEILLLPARYHSTKGLVKSGEFVGIMQHSNYPNERYKKEDLAVAYEIDWGLTRHELRQAIPPAYSEYIGRQLILCI